MKILVLGGTLFLGRAVIEAALQAGHEVSMFNRGLTNPGIFPELEWIRGDRNGDLAELADRTFDAVVDTSGYFPRQVRTIVASLGGFGHYTFVSSMSVYADHSTPGVDESGAVAVVADPSVEDLEQSYGGFKALCEQALVEAAPGRAHNVRAGLIVGPYDNTGRFSYWVDRIGRGGEVLAPRPEDQPVQMIDVRDLAEWVVSAASDGVVGTFNAAGPAGEHTMGSMLREIRALVGANSDLVWVDADFLVDQDVQAWSDLPLWLPAASLPAFAGFMDFDVTAATDRGLTVRPLAETILATREWLESNARIPTKDFGVQVPPGGITSERERQLLDDWYRYQNGPA